VHIIQSILALVFVVNHVPGSPDQTLFEKLLRNFIAKGRARLFQDKIAGSVIFLNTTTNPKINMYSAESIAYASSDIVLRIIHYWVEYNMFSVVCGALPLTFWMLTKSFELLARESKDSEEGEGILWRFKELKLVTRTINSIWATFVLNIVLHSAMRLIWLHDFNQKGNKIAFVYYCIKIGFLVVGLIILAEGCRFVSSSDI